METYNVHEAKTHLSRLIAEAVESGQPFLVARAGHPLVKVVPLLSDEEAAARRVGFMRGRLHYPDDVEELIHGGDKEIAAIFGTTG